MEIFYDGSTRRIRAAREVILSLGTIHTPKVLMQSVTTQVDRYRLRVDGVALAAGRGWPRVCGGLFAVNMTPKEASMSRYSEWARCKKRSLWLLPLVL